MFIFSLAKELKMTVKQLERSMDADELMEWVAYFKATDPEQSKKILAELDNEKTAIEKDNELRAFLNAFT